MDLFGKTVRVSLVVFFIALVTNFSGSFASSLTHELIDEYDPVCANPVSVNAGPSFDSLCLGQSLQLNGEAYGDYTTVSWSTTGDGTFFPNTSTLNAVYNPGEMDQLNMNFTLTLTANADSPCIAASDEIEVLLLDLPVNVTTSNSPVCEGTALDMGAGGGDGFFWTGPNGYTGYSLDTTIYPVGLNQSGTYYVTITNAEGCSILDSVVVLVLPVSVSLEETIIACDSTTLPWGETVTITDSYSKSYEASNGCDSIVTIHVTINNSNTGDTTAFACNSFEWYGQSYFSSTLATHTFTNASGCDSVVTLDLKLGHSSFGDTSATFCGHFLWYGINYTTSGDKVHVFQGGNSQGCDSVLTLHLTIPPADDGNACTTDVCNSETGVINNINITEDDGNACTADVCDTATGITAHNDLTVNDGNACTSDVCDTATDITAHNDLTVNDGNACTEDVCNTLTGVTTHNDKTEEDGNACTIDICDTNTGITVHNNYSFSLTATPGDILCYSGTTCITVTSMNGVGTITYSNGMSSNATGIFCGYAAGGPYGFSAEDENGCSSLSNPVVITQPGKLEIDSITSTPYGCISNDGTATVYPSGGMGAYTFLWTLGGQTTNPAVGLAGGNYCVTVEDANGCTTAPACVSVGSSGSTLPAPEPVSGPLLVCARQNGVAYNVPVIAGALSYTWTVPANATIASGQGSNAITVNFSRTFSGGFISVRDSNACGSSPATLINIGSVTNKPEKPIISGPGIVCKSSTAIYCATSTNATSFNWTVNNGLTILAGTGTSCITVSIPANYNGSGKAEVKGSNCKGLSNEVEIEVKLSKPPTPAITGPSTVCVGSVVTYCATAESATSYNWTLDQGMTILAGTGTSCITVNIPANYNGNGKVKVKGVNCNGIGSEKSMNIKKSVPLVGAPQFCIANSDDNFPVVCAPGKYEYEICLLANASCYTWTAPPGATISDRNGNVSNPITVCSGNQNDVDVTFPAGFTSGFVTVTASNACGSSSTSSFAVTGNPCRIPGEELAATQSLNAYPNPTSGKLNVSFNASGAEKYTLRVVNLLGKVLISEVFTAQEGTNLHELDLRHLAKGMYLISIERDAVPIQAMRIVVE